MGKNDNHLTTSCEECGKKYAVPISSIKGAQAKFKCKQCQNIIIVSKNESQEPDLPNWVDEVGDSDTASDQGNVVIPDFKRDKERKARAGRGAKGILQKLKERATPSTEDTVDKTYKFGLTPKFMVFTLIPFVIISVLSIYFSINKTLEFHGDTIKESSNIVSGIGTDMLSHISDSVAIQTRLYLFSNPDLKNDEFNRDIYFKKVALQRIGATGHTALFEFPGPDGIWRCWAHINPNVVGKDLKGLRKPLWTNTNKYWNILSRAKNSRESKGYFKWVDEDGRLRDKFMVCRPIGGTPYVIAASIYVDEFTKPIRRLEKAGGILAKEMRNNNVLIMGIGLLCIGLITFFYGRNLTGKIKYLSTVTDRISLGNIDEKINMDSNDEIGDLGKAIGRMQMSISVSMDMLQKRE